MRFEPQYPLFDNLVPGYSARPRRKAPNIDIELNGPSPQDHIAFECKFTEPFVKYPVSRRPFTSTYFSREAEPIWDGLNATRALARRLNQRSEDFKRLDAVQLIKTGLACQRRFGRGQWRFVYLWYEVTHDGCASEDCGVLSTEFDRFRELTHEELPLVKMTWQDLFCRIEKTAVPNHSLYLSYLRDRYFGDGQ